MRRRVSRKTRRKVFVRDRFKCKLNISSFCNYELTLDTATVDHIVPSSKGGSDKIDNLQTACFPCNILKGNREILPPLQIQQESVFLPPEEDIEDFIKRANRKYKRRKRNIDLYEA